MRAPLQLPERVTLGVLAGLLATCAPDMDTVLLPGSFEPIFDGSPLIAMSFLVEFLLCNVGVKRRDTTSLQSERLLAIQQSKTHSALSAKTRLQS